MGVALTLKCSVSERRQLSGHLICLETSGKESKEASQKKGDFERDERGWPGFPSLVTPGRPWVGRILLLVGVFLLSPVQKEPQRQALCPMLPRTPVGTVNLLSVPQSAQTCLFSDSCDGPMFLHALAFEAQCQVG